MSASILRLPEVKKRIGASRAAIYRWMNQGSFPQPIHLGSRSIGWLATDVEQWIADRVAARNSDRK